MSHRPRKRTRPLCGWFYYFTRARYFHHQVHAKPPTARPHKRQDKGTTELDDVPPPVPLPNVAAAVHVGFRSAAAHAHPGSCRGLRSRAVTPRHRTHGASACPASALSFVSQSVKPGPRVGTDLAPSSLPPWVCSSLSSLPRRHSRQPPGSPHSLRLGLDKSERTAGALAQRFGQVPPRTLRTHPGGFHSPCQQRKPLWVSPRFYFIF